MLYYCVSNSSVIRHLVLFASGDMQHLLEYETERQRHNLPMMTTIDLLKRLYSNNTLPFVLMRSFGLQATNSLPLLKVGPTPI